MHSKMKGNIAESAVIFALTKAGCNIFKELGDLSKVDLIAEFNGKIITIQVKGKTPKNGVLQLPLKKSGPNYSFHYQAGQFHYFALCNLLTGEVALIDSNILKTHGSCLNLRITQTKNNQKLKTHDFYDFVDIPKILLKGKINK